MIQAEYFVGNLELEVDLNIALGGDLVVLADIAGVADVAGVAGFAAGH